MNIVHRAVRILREQGITVFVRACLAYLTGLRHRFRVRYYAWKKTVSVRLGQATVTFTVDGQDDAVELLYAMETEQPLLQAMMEELGPGDTFWDVGANLGFYSLAVATVFPRVQVLSFEPHPVTARKLRDNISLNRRVNIRVLELALADFDGTAGLTLPQSQKHGQAHLVFAAGTTTRKVRVLTADSLISTGAAARPDVLKIDVEGAELLVIRGMKQAIAQCRTIFCEVHPAQSTRYGYTAEELLEFLQGQGFQLKRLLERAATFHLKASRSQETAG
ncbi:MAG: FkbM family methyltransferase [Dehalococcoidales bacterium]|nr:FkbM family methyltransferase [Dehalococcoidales bacterium]